MKYLYFCIYLFIAALLVEPIVGDCYMQNPRGSNNRLTEDSTNAGNQARLFNSQNNAQGGYCWGPPLTFYTGSKLSIEWTVQHSCGSDNAQCNIVIQYMCTSPTVNGSTLIRDGTGTSSSDTQSIKDATNPMAQNADGTYTYGMHEGIAYYQSCNTRSRNYGLFAADNTINGNTAQFTRQNTNGGQSGYECQEERDYYPYWHPSPWKDVAVLTSQTSLCGYYKSNSQNVIAKNYCTGSTTNPQPVTQQGCLSTGGTWQSAPAWNISSPDCQPAPWSRDNHLGNGQDGFSHRYNWTLPTAGQESCASNAAGCVCVLRIRYNISTSDINGYGMNGGTNNFTDSSSNGASSPVRTNPTIQVGGSNLTITLNTQQYGRTFQDRSHTFNLQQRPNGIPNGATIYNLNVRGKRGNIVQTYPATEYDFVPQTLHANQGDYIHFQWTGCDHNPTGNAGEGLTQTDRSNIVQLADANHNYPISDTSKVSVTPLFDNPATRFNMALLGQVNCLSYDQLLATQTGGGTAVSQNPQNCQYLNAASAYFNGGLLQMNSTGTFYYMSTRNNNFSNRSQKGVIVVSSTGLLPWQIGLIVVACVVVVLAGAAAGCVVFAKMNPHSRVAHAVGRVPLLNRI